MDLWLYFLVGYLVFSGGVSTFYYKTIDKLSFMQGLILGCLFPMDLVVLVLHLPLSVFGIRISYAYRVDVPAVDGSDEEWLLNKAIKELFDIIELEKSKSRTGYDRRDIALRNWIKRWLETYEDKQLILDTDRLTSGFKDVLKMKIARDVLLNALEDCVIVDETKRSLEAELVVIRKKPVIKDEI